MKNNCITEKNLVNFNNQLSKFITKSKFLDQDGPQPKCWNSSICSAIWFYSTKRLVIEFGGVDGLENLWAEHKRCICLDTRACGLGKVYA